MHWKKSWEPAGTAKGAGIGAEGGIRPEVFPAAFDTPDGECTQEDHLGWVLPRSALGSFSRD